MLKVIYRYSEVAYSFLYLPSASAELRIIDEKLHSIGGKLPIARMKLARVSMKLRTTIVKFLPSQESDL
jgi:hypothetical protein